MTLYRIIHHTILAGGERIANPVFSGPLSQCLRTLAMFIGGFDGASRVTAREALERGYRLVRVK